MENDIMLLLDKLNFTNIIWQIITPLIFFCVDIISGYIQAIINHNVDSQKMRMGLLHKVLLIFIIILSFIIRFAFNLNFVSTFVCIYIVLMETVSIMENFKKAGVDLGGLGEILKDKAGIKNDI